MDISEKDKEAIKELELKIVKNFLHFYANLGLSLLNIGIILGMFINLCLMKYEPVVFSYGRNFLIIYTFLFFLLCLLFMITSCYALHYYKGMRHNKRLLMIYKRFNQED